MKILSQDHVIFEKKDEIENSSLPESDESGNLSSVCFHVQSGDECDYNGLEEF